MGIIRLIALDLDGTLLNSAKEVTDQTLNMLMIAASQGIHIVPSTGRSVSGLPDWVVALPFVEYALTLNGAYVVNLRTKEIIYQSTYSREEALQLWKMVQNYDAACDCAIDGELYMERQTILKLPDYTKEPGRIALMRRTRIETDNIQTMLLQENSRAAKIDLLFSDSLKRMEAKKELEKLSFVEISSSLDKNLELNKKGGNKGNGLKALADHLNLIREELMACGDSDNDITMIEAAGLGIAMANAKKEVLDVADRITLSNDEDGVAYAIKKWVLDSRYPL